MKKTMIEKWTTKAAATLEKRIDRAENKRGPIDQIRYCNDSELGCLYVNDAGTVLYRIPGQQIPADASPSLAPMPGLADLFRRVRDDARQQIAAEVKQGTTGDGKAAVALYGEDGARLAIIDAKLYKEAPAGAAAYVAGSNLPVLFTDEDGEPLVIVCPKRAAEFTPAEAEADQKPAKKSRLVSIKPQEEPEEKPEAQPAQEVTEEPKAADDGDTWHDLNGANAAPAGMKWQSNGKSRFSSEYAHRLVKKDPTAEMPAEATETAQEAHEAPSKEEITAEFAKAWKSPSMIKYCAGKVAAVAVLPSGEWITVDKQTIETRFCFGESGYDAEEASEMAYHARTSADYFKRENMKEFSGWLKDLDEAARGDGRYMLVISGPAYTGQEDSCRLRCANFRRITDIIEDLGGSAFLSDLPGKTIKSSWREYRVATAEEITIIRAAYAEAAKAHEKKIDAYLKRYGLSKVNSWTYWIDA